jgi:hypothetical protein
MLFEDLLTDKECFVGFGFSFQREELGPSTDVPLIIQDSKKRLIILIGEGKRI